MKWVLFFLLTVVEILLLLLIIPVTLRIKASDDGTKVYLRVVGIKINLYPQKPKKDHSKEKKKQEDRKDSEKEEKSGLTFEKITEYLSFAADALSWLLTSVKVPVFRLRACIYNEDPARTAVLYGSACAAYGAIMPALERNVKIKKSNVELYPGFGREGFFEFDMAVRAFPVQLVIIAITAFKKWNTINNASEAMRNE